MVNQWLKVQLELRLEERGNQKADSDSTVSNETLEIFTVRSTGIGKCNAKSELSYLRKGVEWDVVYSRYGCSWGSDVLVRIQKYHNGGQHQGIKDPNSPM